MSGTRPLAVALTPLETRRDVVLHVARRAEQFGYDAFFLAEGWGHDAGVLLAEVASRTSTITIGTGVVGTWGRSPATIAMLAAGLAAASGERFVLGLGAGSPALAEGLHGIRFAAPVTRLEAVAVEVRRLLEGERSSTVPPTSTVRPLRLAEPRVGPPPLYLAALGPRSVAVCGEVADGWLPFLLPRSGLADAAARLGEAAAAAGRARPRVCPMLPVAVASDPQEARLLASWWVVFYLVTMGPLYAEALTRTGFGHPVSALLEANPGSGSAVVPDESRVLLDELVLWGDHDHAVAARDAWYDAGADMPVLTLPPGRDLAELDAVLEQLRPTDS